METKQQTAVDWLFKQLWDTPKDKLEWYAILAQAKAIEKEQISDAQMDMFNHINQNKFGVDYLNKRDAAEEYAEQYYTQTYVSNRDNQTL